MKFDWNLIGFSLAFLIGTIGIGFPLIVVIIIVIPHYFFVLEDETVIFLFGVCATILIGFWIYNIIDFYKGQKKKQEVPWPIDLLIREKEYELEMLKKQKESQNETNQ